MVVEDLCKLYGVKKFRTSSYHAQTNGQVEHMNQTLIHLIGKLDEDKKACWSKYLPELLMAYNSTCLAVTGYSPHFLLFGRRPRIPVDYLFPTLRDTPHKSKLEESVALHQTILYDGESDCSDSGTSLPSLLTRQGVDKIPHVWLNGEFRTQLFTQIESEATESPQDSVENDVSDPEPVSTDSDEEET